MTKIVLLSKAAQLSLDAVLEYLHHEWGVKVAADFVVKFERSVKLIATNTTIYLLINEDKRIRRCVLTKHNIIYFREDAEAIIY